MLVKEQTTSDFRAEAKEEAKPPSQKPPLSDNVNFVCKTLCEQLIPDMNTNEKNTLKKHLPEILETAKKTKNWGFNFMTGKIDIFDEVETEGEEEESDSSDSPKERESLRYPIPSYFNPTPYYVYKAVGRLLDRDDIPPYHLSVKNRFIYYFTKILHYGVNAENEYNDYLENRRLISMCGNVFDEELDHNEITNSDFLKLALNMLRDYIDSMQRSVAALGLAEKIESGAVFAPPSFFEFDKYQIEQIIETIEKYLSDLVDPDSKIETDSEEAVASALEGETKGETIDSEEA